MYSVKLTAPVTFKVPFTLRLLLKDASPSRINFWFIDTSPVLVIVIRFSPSVKNCNWSLSSLAAVSALINVSPSTSIIPPSEPHAFPAPKPSNWLVSVL